MARTTSSAVFVAIIAQNLQFILLFHVICSVSISGFYETLFQIYVFYPRRAEHLARSDVLLEIFIAEV